MSRFNPRWSPPSVFEKASSPGASIDSIFEEVDEARLPGGLPILQPDGSHTKVKSWKTRGGSNPTDSGRHPADN